jgi:hypothetical protein
MANVAVAVQLHIVAGGKNPLRRVWVIAHALADHEERSLHAMPLELGEHGLRPLLIGTIIEGKAQCGWHVTGDIDRLLSLS